MTLGHLGHCQTFTMDLFAKVFKVTLDNSIQLAESSSPPYTAYPLPPFSPFLKRVTQYENNRPSHVACTITTVHVMCLQTTLHKKVFFFFFCPVVSCLLLSFIVLACLLPCSAALIFLFVLFLQKPILQPSHKPDISQSI